MTFYEVETGTWINVNAIFSIRIKKTWRGKYLVLIDTGSEKLHLHATHLTKKDAENTVQHLIVKFRSM